jgi:alpha-mannosidase
MIRITRMKNQTRTIHLVCNAHLDPVWQWEWEEGVAAALSTFRSAADLCEEFDYVFCHNEAILYRWVEEFEPTLFVRIQKLVAAGKWRIMGGWHLQPDCNMPSGESFVRQALLGRTYFMEKFGVAPTTAINLDPFGHTQGLVQILAKCGYDSYIVCRPDPGNLELPAETFWWQGYDGSRILVTRAWGHYLSALGKARQKVENLMRDRPEEAVSLVLWGVGNHGGGPSRQDLLDLGELIASTQDSVILHSNPEAYFADYRARVSEIPIHNGDLNPWGVGCYTSQSRIKHKHRLLENDLYLAEKMAISAWGQGLIAYPQDELLEASRDLATGQFHDILPGSSIQPVEEMGLRLFDHGLEITSRVKGRAFFALASGQGEALEGEVPVLVYNPHPQPVQAIVECEFMLADQNWENSFTIATAYQGGQPLPTQIEQELGNVNLDWRKRVVFAARLDPAQMNRFDCRLERVLARPRPEGQIQGGAFTFTNEQIQVMINAHTGLLDSYKVDGNEFVRPGACQALVITDTPDPWGMTVRSFRNVEGAFELLTDQESARFAGVAQASLPPLRVIEDGPVRTVVEALFGYRESRLCLRYKLPRRGAEIELDLSVHWAEKDRMLKLSLPTPYTDGRLLGQVAYGVAELPANGDEAVSQKWCALVGNGSALTAINDRTYGLDFTEGELRLSLLRSSAYAAHPILERPVMPVDRYSPRQDQGERNFRFWLEGGEAGERLSRVDQRAQVHNEAPIALTFFPEGSGSPLPSFVTLSDPVIVASALKKAGSSDDVVLRLFNPTGHRRASMVSFPAHGMELTAILGAYEVQTLRINLTTGAWIETNLLEELP